MTYAACCAFKIAPPAVRELVISKSLRAQYARIARLGPWLGTALDQAGIAYRWIRWVAYGDGAHAQQERFALVMAGKPPAIAIGACGRARARDPQGIEAGALQTVTQIGGATPRD